MEGASVRARNTFLSAALVGILAGLISGLFGVGGGVVIVPGLVFLVGLNQRLAHGTSLAAIAPIAAAALIGYLIDGLVYWEAAALLIAGSVIGAYAGTHWLHRLPIRGLQIGFGILLVVAAARLFVSIGPGIAQRDLTLTVGVALAVVGLFAGALSGMMGVGGGIVMVPAMVILFGIPDAVAKGTSLAVILPTAAVGTIRNLANRNADLKMAAVVGAAGIASAFIASRIAVDLNPRLSQALFGGFLVLVAARTFAQARRGY
ncbi:MAG: sulfite exporter TauE/SafE family protein [Acidimicrobiia bacterium]